MRMTTVKAVAPYKYEGGFRESYNNFGMKSKKLIIILEFEEKKNYCRIKKNAHRVRYNNPVDVASAERLKLFKNESKGSTKLIKKREKLAYLK